MIGVLFLQNSSNLYSLTNKDNTVSTRILGLNEMLSGFKLFGNHQIEIYGVGLFAHYLTLYGIFAIVVLLLMLKKIIGLKNRLFTYLFIFSIVILSKGYSSIFIVILILSLNEKAFSCDKHPQAV
jgi:hypothetical protein